MRKRTVKRTTIKTTACDTNFFKYHREIKEVIEENAEPKEEKSKDKSRLVSGVVAIAALFRAIRLLYTVVNWWDIAESVCDVILILLS